MIGLDETLKLLFIRNPFSIVRQLTAFLFPKFIL